MPAFLNNASNKLGSVANDKLGGLLNKITGLPSQDIPKYEDFLYKILSDANNAVTESSYWVVFFTRLENDKEKLNDKPAGPKKSLGAKVKGAIVGAVKGYLSSQFGIEGKTKYDNVKLTGQIDVGKWVQGAKTAEAVDQFFNNAESCMMLVQGVEIPGDGYSVDRGGSTVNAGGFLKPAMTGMRTDIPEMNITFLENNSSVTDLVLRPWVIESSYRSLKFANKANITCYNLTRSPSGFRIRKRFTFYNACPTSIDAEQYEYSNNGGYGKRQVKFIYTHYSLDEGDDMKDGLFASIANMVGQKVKNALSNIVEGGTDVIAGGANQVVTNVVGEFSGAVSDHVDDIQSRVREYGKNAEGSLIDKASSAIKNAIGFNPDSDSLFGPGLEYSKDGVDNNPAPRIIIPANLDDKMKSPPVPPRSKKVVNDVTYDIRGVAQDDTAKYRLRRTRGGGGGKGIDTPDTSALSLQHVEIGEVDTSIGGVDTTHVTINDVDTPNVGNVGLKSVSIDGNDTASTVNTAPVVVGGDDTPNSSGLTTQSVTINSDDTVNGINISNVSVNGSDTSDSSGLTTQSVTIDGNDTVTNVDSNTLSINNDDTADSNGLSLNQVTISRDDNVDNVTGISIVTPKDGDTPSTANLEVSNVKVDKHDMSFGNADSSSIVVDGDDTPNTNNLKIDKVSISSTSEGPKAVFVPINKKDVI